MQRKPDIGPWMSSQGKPPRLQSIKKQSTMNMFMRWAYEGISLEFALHERFVKRRGTVADFIPTSSLLPPVWFHVSHSTLPSFDGQRLVQAISRHLHRCEATNLPTVITSSEFWGVGSGLASIQRSAAAKGSHASVLSTSGTYGQRGID